jgi:hypothetical protein
MPQIDQATPNAITTSKNALLPILVASVQRQERARPPDFHPMRRNFRRRRRK